MQEDPACTYQPTGQPLTVPYLEWSDEAQQRLDRIPINFIREKVRKGVESYAERQGAFLITAEIMEGALSGANRPKAFETLPFMKGGRPNEVVHRK
jgi:hypothetical protein